MELKRKYIPQTISAYTIDSFNYGPIEAAIDFFVNIKKELEEEGFKNLRVDLCCRDDWTELEIIGERLETDAEFEKRQRKILLDKENAEKSKSTAAKREYAMYLKLKEKFEKSSEDNK
jgi:hypothetical protein